MCFSIVFLHCVLGSHGWIVQFWARMELELGPKENRTSKQWETCIGLPRFVEPPNKGECALSSRSLEVQFWARGKIEPPNRGERALSSHSLEVQFWARGTIEPPNRRERALNSHGSVVQIWARGKIEHPNYMFSIVCLALCFQYCVFSIACFSIVLLVLCV